MVDGEQLLAVDSTHSRTGVNFCKAAGSLYFSMASTGFINAPDFYSDGKYAVQSKLSFTGGRLVSDPKPEINFEKALAELEQLVETMEKGDLTLEESLQQFERGVSLTRSCQQALAAAEQKVRILTQDNDTGELAEFAPTRTEEL